MSIAPINAPSAFVLDAVHLALHEAASIRAGAGEYGHDSDGDTSYVGAAGRKAVAEILDFDVAFLPAECLAEIEEMDAPAMVGRLVDECEEIDIPDTKRDRLEIVWRVKAGKSMGQVTCATCKPIGKRERQTWQGAGPAPWWRLTLALDVWLLMTTEERWRLLHHELMHATVKKNSSGKITGPTGRGHGIEEHAATLARYGVGEATQAAFVGQVLARKKIVKEVRAYEIDPKTGNGLLFGTDLRPVGWAT